MDQGKPVLGICRGAQLINVVFGGSLHPEIRGLYEETTYVRSVLRRKKVHIVPNTRLSQLLPRGKYWVNSLHRELPGFPGTWQRSVHTHPAGY
ncbi:MAG: hypothetical protein B9S32_14910 [Verrucomicrobia bacterium Tous-C9LFEB]|nr:MAG: hypothetical protein B9S32_14910 [Verrucomicrobia bacterium Tous-C9LFEB]